MKVLVCVDSFYLSFLWACSLTVLICLADQDSALEVWLGVELGVLSGLVLLALLAFRKKSGDSWPWLAVAVLDLLLIGVFFALSIWGVTLVVQATSQPKAIHFTVFALILLYAPYQIYRLCTCICGISLICKLHSSKAAVHSEGNIELVDRVQQANLCTSQSHDDVLDLGSSRPSLPSSTGGLDGPESSLIQNSDC